MRRIVLESLLGGIVLVAAAIFLVWGVREADVGGGSGYELQARFLKAGGVSVGSDVEVNGIKVGTVSAISLDSQTFEAKVVMEVRTDLRLPNDTVAVIATDGLLDRRYVQLRPGKSKTVLAPGAVITKTEILRSLEELVGEIIFLTTDGAQSP